MDPVPTQASTTPPPPQHVAIIMDGNGRWAHARGLPRAAGHKRGAESVRKTIKAAAELGVRYLTLYGFSTENWKRPTSEIDDLMGLLRFYLRSEIAELHRNAVRIRVIGDRTRLAGDIVALIEQAETQTRENQRLDLVVALSYGARDEIVRAAREIAKQAVAGEIECEDIDQCAFERHLLTAEVPDPDLMIRTSGELRLSNFLLWQCAYAELVFTDTLWPDFDRSDLEAAISEYNRRERRYGASSA